jgi:hypothetical protein
MRSRVVRWIAVSLLAGSFAAAAGAAIVDRPALTEEQEIARRARQASWIVARERERARDRHAAEAGRGEGACRAPFMLASCSVP